MVAACRDHGGVATAGFSQVLVLSDPQVGGSLMGGSLRFIRRALDSPVRPMPRAASAPGPGRGTGTRDSGIYH